MAVGTVYQSPETGWTRYEDTDARIWFQGSWTRSATPNFTRYANTADAILIVKFTGTKIRLLVNQFTINASQGYSGNFNYTIDGIAGNGVSQVQYGYNAGISIKKQLCTLELTGLAAGEHTLIVQVVTGTANYVGFSYVDIESTGELLYNLNQPMPYPDDSWRRFSCFQYFTFTGTTWGWVADSKHYNNGEYESQVPYEAGRKLSFKFLGDRVRLLGPKINTSWTTSATVKVDGVNKGTFSQYNSQAMLYNTFLFEVLGLEFKEHTVEVICDTGYVSITGFDTNTNGKVVGLPKQRADFPEIGYRRIEDNNPNITRIGAPWSWVPAGGTCTGGGYMNTTVNGTSMKFNFSGTKLRINQAMAPDRALINLYIDGVKVASGRNNDKSDASTPYVLFDVKGLEDKEHYVVIESDASMPGNGTQSFNIDSIDIDWDAFIFPYSDTGAFPLKTVRNVDAMEVGDRIPARYTGVLSAGWNRIIGLGTTRCTQELPYNAQTTALDGIFYFVKTDRGTLVSDRVLAPGKTRDSIAYNKQLEGSWEHQALASYLAYAYKCEHDGNGWSTRYNISYVGSGHCTLLLDQQQELLVKENDIVEVSYTESVTNASYMSSRIILMDEEKVSTVRGNDGSSTTDYALRYEYGFPASNTEYAVKYRIDMKKRTIQVWRDGVYLREDAAAYPWTSYYPTADKRYVINIGSYCSISYSSYPLKGNHKINNLKVTINGVAVYDMTDAAFKAKAIKASQKMVRSLTGGCTYMGTDGSPSITDKSLGGWPLDNEWDKLMNNSLNGKIAPGDNKIWHTEEKGSHVMEFASYGSKSLPNVTVDNSYSVFRGFKDGYQANSKVRMDFVLSYSGDANVGFRPVLEIVDNANSKSNWV